MTFFLKSKKNSLKNSSENFNQENKDVSSVFTVEFPNSEATIGHLAHALVTKNYHMCPANNGKTFGSLRDPNLEGMPNGRRLTLFQAMTSCNNNENCGGFTRGEHSNNNDNILGHMPTYFKSKEHEQIENSECDQESNDEDWQSYFKDNTPAPTTRAPTPVPTTTSSSDSDGSNVGLIIGIIVGLLLLLIVPILLQIYGIINVSFLEKIIEFFKTSGKKKE
tara:strand:- start:644 stop:1306 length:663 start_codon:yes stop_codon:yes gene_type:complete